MIKWDVRLMCERFEPQGEHYDTEKIQEISGAS